MRRNPVSVVAEQPMTEDAASVETAAGRVNHVVARAFAERFNELLDKFGFPAHNAGRHTLLGDRFGVSVQTAGKWCTGHALPSPSILIAMARELHVSIDWLLGQTERPLMAASQAEMPIYRLEPSASCAGHDKFVRDTSIIYSKRDGFVDAMRHRCIFVNWCELLDPAFRRGDLLIADLYVNALSEDDCYVLRSGSLTTVQRIHVALDASVSAHRRTRFEATTTQHHSTDFVFNTDRTVDAQPVPGKILVVGRVSGYVRGLSGGIPGFGSL